MSEAHRSPAIRVPAVARRLQRAPTMLTAPGGRRLVAFAFAIDYLVIAAYLGLLTRLGLALQRVSGRALTSPRTVPGRLLGQCAGAAVLTLPVALYFALCEASPAQATLGKRAVRLRVVGPAGRRLSYGRSLLRAAVKFAPWEAAHAALWHTPGWPAHPEPGGLTFGGATVSLLATGWYLVSLFVGDRRTPYDRAAGTRVVAT